MMTSLDPALFRADAIDPETLRINEEVEAFFSKSPPIDQIPLDVLRNSRATGESIFPLLEKSDRAETRTIPEPGGDIGLRIMRPKSGTPRGVYLHIHGGGWVVGANDQADPAFEHYADDLGLAVVSVDYRLAPENPFPAAPDDCEAAAAWLVGNARAEFGTDWLAIGGESAGGHLAALTLLRMRDRHDYTGFKAANLVFGVFDVSRTPSVRNWGSRYLVLNTYAMSWFCDCFVPDEGMRQNPEVSPLYADLSHMPHALFSVGTQDLLLDDTLMMQARWTAAGNTSQLEVYPGAPHGFPAFGGPMGKRYVKTVDAFFTSALEGSA
ncbi:MAG: alpha/beta hydrolase [Alphaproteobacteria bacterium]